MIPNVQITMVRMTHPGQCLVQLVGFNVKQHRQSAFGGLSDAVF